jgi:hypothetical protein
MAPGSALPLVRRDGKLTSRPRFYTVSEVLADGFFVLLFLPARFRI